MKNRKCIFKILISAIFMFVIISFPTFSKAVWLKDVFDLGDSFMNLGSNATKNSEVAKYHSEIFNVLSTIGMITSVVVGGILGINFMLSSAEDKAKIKESMMPYVLGCIIIFSAFGIWKVVIAALNGI